MADTPRTIRAPRGTTLSCRSWQQEAALRMLMNNLDPEVAERPQDLVVYGGIGKAARVVQNAARVLGIELLAATEAIEFHRPTRSSAPLEAVHALVRERVAAHGQDRPLAPEIEALAALVRSGAVVRAAESAGAAVE